MEARRTNETVRAAFARSILAPVAANPHGGWPAAKAKQLIAASENAPEGTPLDLRNLADPVDVPEGDVPGGEG